MNNKEFFLAVNETAKAHNVTDWTMTATFEDGSRQTHGKGDVDGIYTPEAETAPEAKAGKVKK